LRLASEAYRIRLAHLFDPYLAISASQIEALPHQIPWTDLPRHYQHVQAIIVAIDQYAETALGNRGYFLNKPHSIGGKNDKIP
jgi:hypothetical protein